MATADPRRHLLIRRSLVPGAKGVRELAFYLCFAPEDRPVTLRVLIKVAGRRWPVEEDFQVGKDAFGLDHSQVRTYPALLRHLVLSMAALAVCAVVTAWADTTGDPPPPQTTPDDVPPADPGLIPLTVAEVKRLVNLLTRDLAQHRTPPALAPLAPTPPSPRPLVPPPNTTQPPMCDGAEVSVSQAAAIAQVMTASNSARSAPSRACMDRPCTTVV